MPERSKWTAVAWAAVAAALAFVVIRALGGGSTAPPPVRVEQEASDSRGTSGRHAGTGGLFVHVAGAVRRPGLYRVPDGSRVAAALEVAGGPSRRAEVAAVNLAAPVEDGQQVVVPRRGAGAVAGPAAGSAGGQAGGAPGAPISLATATAEQLDELDGIGPTLAERILAFRERNGGFRSLEQLREVDGIGEKRFEALKEALRP